MDTGLIPGSVQNNVRSFGLDEFVCLTPNRNTTSKVSSRGGRFHRGQTWSLTVYREREYVEN